MREVRPWWWGEKIALRCNGGCGGAGVLRRARNTDAPAVGKLRARRNYPTAGKKLRKKEKYKVENIPRKRIS